MKLKTDNGHIIKIIPGDSRMTFDKSLYNKRVIVKGTPEESRITKTYVDKMETDKTLLCHIDHTPCKDSKWVQNKIKSGKAEKISATDIRKLRNRMAETQQNYVSLITIQAQKIVPLSSSTEIKK